MTSYDSFIESLIDDPEDIIADDSIDNNEVYLTPDEDEDDEYMEIGAEEDSDEDNYPTDERHLIAVDVDEPPEDEDDDDEDDDDDFEFDEDPDDDTDTTLDAQAMSGSIDDSDEYIEDDFLEAMMHKINAEIVHEAETCPPPVIIDGVQEGFLSSYKDKPFTGKYSNIKLVIGKRGAKNINIDKTVVYIQHVILPHLDKVIDQVANKAFVSQLFKKKSGNVEVYRNFIHETFRTIRLNSTSNGNYIITAIFGTDTLNGISIATYKGTIDFNGNMNFKYDGCVTNHIV